MIDKNIGSKRIYKIFLSILKYIPITVSMVKVINTILNYFGIFSPILLYLGGTSFPFLLILYLLSIIFRYCYLYKMPLYYIATIDGLIFISKIIVIDSIDIYRIYFIISGIFMISYIAYAYLTRNNPNRKIDHIKDFCERYCKC